MFASSQDGGRTFFHPRAILHTGAIMFAVETLERANGFAQIAASAQRLYITWSDYRNGDLDVFCASSADNGRTRTSAVSVNNDPIHNGADQFFQWLAVDPNDGAMNVMFYDRRGDPENRKQIVVLARSTDDGGSFANYAWTEKPFEARRRFLRRLNGTCCFRRTCLRRMDGNAERRAWLQLQNARAAFRSPSHGCYGGSCRFHWQTGS